MEDKKRFIVSYYLIGFLSAFLFVKQFVTYILNSKFDPIVVSSIMNIYSLVKIILEIPTGAFSDYFGVKKSLVLGISFYIIGYLSILFSKTQAAYVFFYFCYGMQSTILSGSKESFLYNNIYYFKLNNNLTYYESMKKVLYTVAFFVSSFGGGLLIKNHLNIAIVLDLLSNIIFLLLVIFIKDPVGDRLKKINTNYFQIIKKGFNYCFKHTMLQKFMIFEMFWNTIWLVFLFYSTIIFSGIKNIPFNLTPPILLVITNFLILLSQMVFLKFFINLDIYKKLFCFVLGGILLLASYVFYYSFANFFIITLYLALMQIIFVTFYHKTQVIIPSRLRSTVISFNGFLYAVARFACLRFLGKFAKAYSYRAGFLILSIIFLVTAILSFWLLYKDKHLQKIREKFNRL